MPANWIFGANAGIAATGAAAYEQARDLPATERERSHVAAVGLLISGGTLYSGDRCSPFGGEHLAVNLVTYVKEVVAWMDKADQA